MAMESIADMVMDRARHRRSGSISGAEKTEQELDEGPGKGYLLFFCLESRQHVRAWCLGLGVMG